MSNEPFTVEITDIALPDGYGVAKRDGFVIFVPDSVPGDRVKVKIVKQNRKSAHGELLEIEVPSLFRLTPPCPHFADCGGCTMQNLLYKKQLQVKENYLKETLKRIGRIEIDNIKISPIVPSPDRYYYRSKIELAFGEDKHGAILGMRKRVPLSGNYTRDVAPLKKCVVFSEKTEKIILLFEGFANKYRLPAYNHVKGRGLLRHLILREAKSTGELMTIIETTNGKLPDMSGLWQILIREIPNIKSLYRVVNNRPGDVINYVKKYHIFGKPCIEDVLGELSFRIYPESFFQPNPATASLLYTKLAELSGLDGNKKVLGLYCGIAPIELFLSHHAREVIGIDSSHTNIINAKENCRINGINNCTFYEGRVEDILKNLQLNDIDLLVIDPPREGISKEGLQLIYKINPIKIAYVSCNPSTLARDLQDFSKNGYIILECIPFDLFPHTSHLETLAILETRPTAR
jgi:23S rRNA (uracil1939-C5)-methyltransferase